MCGYGSSRYGSYGGIGSRYGLYNPYRIGAYGDYGSSLYNPYSRVGSCGIGYGYGAYGLGYGGYGYGGYGYGGYGLPF